MAEDVATLQSDYEQAYDNARWQTGQDASVGTYSLLGKLGGFDAAAQNRQDLLNSYMSNAFNSAEAAKNRNWQEYMSNTANQRAAADYAALGFSPLALLGGGNSASTPSGATASGGKASAHNSESGSVLGNIFKLIASIVVANTAANAQMTAANTSANAKIAAANTYANAKMYQAGNTAATVAKNAVGASKVTAAQQVAAAKEWNKLLEELGNIPARS